MTGRAPNLSALLEDRGPFDPAAITYREARKRAHSWYRANGRANGAPSAFLSQTGKLAVGPGFAIGLQLRPGDASGLEACIYRTTGCTVACVLETSFYGKGENTRDGRTMRTLFLAADPQAMITCIDHELRALVAKHGSVAFRPNVASDLRFEYIAPMLFEIPGVRAYDYTKADPRKHRGSHPNYHLTYSVSEHPLSARIGRAIVDDGGNAAVVVRCAKHATPDRWDDRPAVDGDLTDDRTTDPPGTYVLLAVKADGRADATGFVKELPLSVA